MNPPPSAPAKERDVIVHLNVTPPSFNSPRINLDPEYVLNGSDPRPFDAYLDNGIVLSSLKPEVDRGGVVRCFNEASEAALTPLDSAGPMGHRGQQEPTKLGEPYYPLLEPFDTPDPSVVPLKTDVACWWCCHPFMTPPLGAPIKYEHAHNRFVVAGCFCSFGCAYAWMRVSRGYRKHIPLLKFMFSQATSSVAPGSLVPAPPRETLQLFGGPFTIDQFRSTAPREYRVLCIPNQMPIKLLVEDVGQSDKFESGSILQALRRVSTNVRRRTPRIRVR